jgi:hypothetical protein
MIQTKPYDLNLLPSISIIDLRFVPTSILIAGPRRRGTPSESFLLSVSFFTQDEC